MAKVILGPLVESIQGKVGGITFRRIGARNYASITARPKLYRQPRQSTNRYLLVQAAKAWRDLSTPQLRFWRMLWHRGEVRHPLTGKKFTSARHLFISYQTMRLHCFADPPILPMPRTPLFTPMLTTGLWDIGADSAMPPSGMFQLLLPNGTRAVYKALFGRIGPVTNRYRDYVRIYPQPGLWVDAGMVNNIDYCLYRTLGDLPGSPDYFDFINWPLPDYSYFAYGMDSRGRFYSYTPTLASVADYYQPDPGVPYSGDP